MDTLVATSTPSIQFLQAAPAKSGSDLFSLSSSSSTDRTDNHDKIVSRNDNMHREEERLKTFEKWPVPFLSPEQLARNGFYYLGRGDEVRCAFCKVEIMRWVDGDDPAKDHKRWAPQCPFLNRNGAGNVPLDSSASAGRDECGTKNPTETTSPVRLPGPAHPRYASVAARINSFQDWPRSMRQKPEDLAEAGFFYTGQGDKTKCFYCDGGLKDWEIDDIPWEQHARWFDRCAYLQLVKGREYVQKVISEACQLPASGEQTTTEAAPKPSDNESQTKEDEENSMDATKLCKICYAEERNICFVPCGHVIACAKCVLSTDKCPMCRTPFRDAIRLYFS